MLMDLGLTTFYTSLKNVDKTIHIHKHCYLPPFLDRIVCNAHGVWIHTYIYTVTYYTNYKI